MSEYLSQPPKQISILFFLLLIILANSYIFPNKMDNEPQESKFKIVFVADVRVAANKDWLEKIVTDWGATGICLRVFWGHVDTDSIPGADNWFNLDRAIRTITESNFANKKLDIYLRVCLGLQKPIWVSPLSKRFTKEDFQIKYDNSIYDHQAYEKGIPESERYPLNFNLPNSQKMMKNFLREVLIHLDKEFPDSVKSRIKEVVPTFSTSDEEEYPFAAMCGYSSFENEEFRKYLQNKYSNSLANLNENWDSQKEFKDLNEWSEIFPEKYKWHTYDNDEYKYPNGRVDWINFRTKMLSGFINSLGKIISSFGFEMGVQIGCIYDDLIERRGWADPTRLFENVNSIHVADIYQYAENFDFGAEYLSSISKFWTESNSSATEPVRFTTETNWPNFNGKDPSFLSFYWKEQLIGYYNEGSSEHYLVGWDVTPSELDELKNLYKSWRKSLRYYSNREMVKQNNKVAVHLGVEQVFYNHNVKSIWYKTFELNSFFSAEYESVLTADRNGSGVDIITNYMIEKNPGYLNSFNSIYFADTDGYITENAYINLTNYLSEKPNINSTLEQLNYKKESPIMYRDEYDKIYKTIPTTIILNKE